MTLVIMTNVALNVELGGGWTVPFASLSEGFSPIVLVKLVHDAVERYVRLDADKKMLIDQPPTMIDERALDEITDRVNQERRRAMLASFR